MKKASITSAFLWVSCLHAQAIYQTNGFLLEINSKAEIVKLVDRQNKVNYVPADHPGYLVRVKTTSKKELAPVKMQADKNLLHFSFAEGITLAERNKLATLVAVLNQAVLFPQNRQLSTPLIFAIKSSKDISYGVESTLRRR